MARLRGYKGRQRCRGTALAEAAIVLMLLMLVTLGALQYGWAFYCLQRATNAARQGARMAAVKDAVAGNAITEMERLITAAEFAGRTCTLDPPDATANGDGMVSATVFLPASSVQLIQWNLLPVPDLKPTVTMRKEGSE